MFRIHSYLTRPPPCALIQLPIYFFIFPLVLEDLYGYLRPLSALHVLPGFLFASYVLTTIYRSTRIRALGVLAVLADVAAGMCLLLVPWERHWSFPTGPVVAFALRTLGRKMGWGKYRWWLLDVYVFCALSPPKVERFLSSEVVVFVVGVLGCGCVLLRSGGGAGWAVIKFLAVEALLAALLFVAAMAVLKGLLVKEQVYVMIVGGAGGLVVWLRYLLSPFEAGLGAAEGEKMEGVQEARTGSATEAEVHEDETWMENIKAGRAGVMRSRPRLSDIYWGPQDEGTPDESLDRRLATGSAIGRMTEESRDKGGNGDGGGGEGRARVMEGACVNNLVVGRVHSRPASINVPWKPPDSGSASGDTAGGPATGYVAESTPEKNKEDWDGDRDGGGRCYENQCPDNLPVTT